MVPRSKNITHNVKPHATTESRASTWKEYPQLWARRGVTVLQCARGDSLQEEGVVADFSEVDRGAIEAREYFSNMCG